MTTFLQTFFLAGILLIGAHSAYAKTIILRWKPVEGAVKYQIEMKRGKKVVTNKYFPGNITEWKNIFTPGLYVYQVRGIDQWDQPGTWSKEHLLPVAPGIPSIKDPADGHVFRAFPGRFSINLKWSTLPGIKTYTVNIYRDFKLFTSKTIKKSKLTLKDLKAGTYTWSVQGVLPTDNATTKGMDLSNFSGPASAMRTLLVEEISLSAPQFLNQEKEYSQPSNKKLKLSWLGVTDAQAYEVKVRYLGTQNNTRMLAHSSEKVPSTTYFTHHVLDVPKEGFYEVEVKPVVLLDNQGPLNFKGPPAVARFQVTR